MANLTLFRRVVIFYDNVPKNHYHYMDKYTMELFHIEGDDSNFHHRVTYLNGETGEEHITMDEPVSNNLLDITLNNFNFAVNHKDLHIIENI